MTGFEKSYAPFSFWVIRCITLLILLSQHHFFCSTISNPVNPQVHFQKVEEMDKGLYGNAVGKPFGDISFLTKAIMGNRFKIPPPLPYLSSSKRAEEQQDIEQTRQKLVKWIAKHTLRQLMEELPEETLDPTMGDRITDGEMAIGETARLKPKRTMNCKPLKEQFLELQGEVFKKGDNSFKNTLRDFFANCNNNDGIRF